jgi:hypothetical protein
MSRQRILLLAVAIVLGVILIDRLIGGENVEVLFSFIGTVLAVGGFIRDPQVTKENANEPQSATAHIIENAQFTPTSSFEGGMYGGLIGGMISGVYGGISYSFFAKTYASIEVNVFAIVGLMVVVATLSGGMLGSCIQLFRQWLYHLGTKRVIPRYIGNDVVGGGVGGSLAGIVAGGIGGVLFGSKVGLPIPHPADILIWSSPALVIMLFVVFLQDYRGSIRTIFKGLVIGLICAAAFIGFATVVLLALNIYVDFASYFAQSTVTSMFVGGIICGVITGSTLGLSVGVSNLLIKVPEPSSLSGRGT